MNQEPSIRGRNDFQPEVPPPPSLPPEGKVTLQLALTIALGLVVVVSLVGAICGVVDKASLSNAISVAIGGILGLLTGGNRVTR